MEDFENVAKIAAATYDQIILFEGFLRGKKQGYISETLKIYLLKHGMNKNKIEIILNEHDAVQFALDSAKDGDLIVLSNYDIKGIHERIADHKEMLEKQVTQ